MKSLLICALLFAICFEFIFAFDPKNRPRARKKIVTGNGKGVYRRGEGLGTGPVGPIDRVKEIERILRGQKKNK